MCHQSLTGYLKQQMAVATADPKLGRRQVVADAGTQQMEGQHNQALCRAGQKDYWMHGQTSQISNKQSGISINGRQRMVKIQQDNKQMCRNKQSLKASQSQDKWSASVVRIKQVKHRI